jgi:hypothetical protein
MAESGDIAGQSGVLSEFAGKYVSDMLGKTKALADKPYNAYGGPLTAGASGLQNKAVAGYGALDPNQSTDVNAYGWSTAPGSYGGGITAGSFGFGSGPGSFGFGNAAGQGYSSGFNAGSADLSGMQAGIFQNDYNPQAFNAQAAQQYMHPYLQAALNPQIAEVRRQQAITQSQDAGRAAQAGAFGGSRSFIMDAERARNTGQQIADITGQGYARAFDTAQGQFNTEQQRLMADRNSRMGQYNTEENMRQRIAEVGIDQFNKEQAGLRTDEAARRGQFNTEADRLAAFDERRRGQFNTETDRDMQFDENRRSQFNEEERARRELEERRRSQFNTETDRDMQFDEYARSQFNEEERARRELEERRRNQFNTETDRSMQFDEYGRNQFNTEENRRIDAAEADRRYGLDSLSAINRAGADQRAIEQEGITADYLQYQQEQQYPYEQLKFMQSMLEGLPVAARQTSYVDPSSYESSAAGIKEILALLGYGTGGAGEGEGAA